MLSGRLERIAVVGGSIAGLTAALLLRDAGFDVDVFERSATGLEGYGAGIVLHDRTARYLVERRGLRPDEIGASTEVVRTLDRAGALLLEEKRRHRFASWNAVHRGLLTALPPERHHRDSAVVALAPDADGVELAFAAGGRARFDAVVGADGIGSTLRGLLLGGSAPTYAGYVGWRGTVRLSSLSAAARTLGDALTYVLEPRGHVVAYPIEVPADGRTERLLNYVWYRNVAAGPELDRLTTDRYGVRRELSVPLGDSAPAVIAEVHEAAAGLPAPIREAIARSSPFLQVIVDLEPVRMAFGRVFLIGDAASVARPHAGAGAAKACDDAWTLAAALTEARDGDEGAVARWDAQQVGLGRGLVARSREMGERAQALGTWTPGDPALRFGLHGPGE